MPEVYVLDNVVMKLSEADASKYTSSLTKRLVIIDAKTKQVLEKKPLITLGRQLEFFLVSNEDDPRNIAESSILGFAIRDFAADRSIGISLQYQVSCFVGHEEKVALALFDDSTTTPGVVFEGKLIGWLKDYTSKNIEFNDFTTSYAQKLKDLQVHAVNKSREIGLNLRLRLSLELEAAGQLKSFSIFSGDFPVVLSDLIEEQMNFRFQTDLSISENGKVNAILNYRKLGELRELLLQKTQTYLRNHAYLYDFCYKFNELIRPKLISHLDQVLSIHGRKIDHFSVENSVEFKMPDLGSIKYVLPFNIKGYEKPVEIQYSLDIEPILKSYQAESSVEEKDDLSKARENFVRYRRAKLSDLQSWFKRELERIVDRHLFGWSYVDLVLRYDSKSNEEELRSKLNEKANEIGYSVRVISTIPDVKPITYKTEGFSIEKDETFSTKQNSVKIRLQINVRGKIEDLESIKRFLNDPRVNLDELISREVIDSIKRVLHEVEAADFYAQEGLIYYLDDFSTQESVKDKIADAVQKSLEKKFGASSVEVSLQVLETELLSLINNLTGRAYHNFEIKIASVRDAGEPVHFTGSFQINGVAKDKWDVFASCKPSVEDVRDFLQNQLRYWFGSLSTRTLSYETTQGLLKILADANTLTSKDIINSFGLLISLHRLEISDTEKKAALRSLQLASEMKNIEEAKEQIHNDRGLRGIEIRTSLNDIEHLNQELELVREQLRSLSTQTGGEDRKNKLMEREKELNNKLSEAVKSNRNKASEITSQKTQQSMQSSTDESDFDALVQYSKASPPAESKKLDSKTPSNSLSDDNQIIDV
ncbi:MAG: hypothetical protein O9323_21010 [Microcystis sp. LE19-131.1A]|uniref:hypothetical protein n=1 Tax=Microcystis sp. LE19-131.1A TaxID=3016439 RepID=UPI0022C64C97|nr:hypothetical protein [Microcystis sp. LE19-131.1A]MCZ8244160.1 hypothetical protein [Microcystis sp. LE19-131.1A]